MWPIDKGNLTALLSGALPALGAYSDGALELSCERYSYVELDATLALGASATTNTAELVVERSPVVAGDDWQAAETDLDASGTPSAGVLVAPVNVLHRTLTVTSSTVPEARTWRVPVYGADRVRVRARETGDTTHPATLTVRARPVAVGA